MKRNFLFITLFSVVLFFAGCGTMQPQYVDETKVQGPSSLGLDREDFEKAAMDATESLLRSPVLNKQGGGRYVVAIDRIINDTTQRIDTDLLTKKIRIAMLNSGKAVVTTAIKVGGPESTLTHSVRELRDDDEMKSNTIAKKGTIIAPDMGLSGKIIQRNTKTSKKEQRVDHYFQLTLTHLESGLALWEEEITISKIGSNKSVSW